MKIKISESEDKNSPWPKLSRPLLPTIRLANSVSLLICVDPAEDGQCGIFSQGWQSFSGRSRKQNLGGTNREQVSEVVEKIFPNLPS